MKNATDKMLSSIFDKQHHGNSSGDPMIVQDPDAFIRPCWISDPEAAELQTNLTQLWQLSWNGAVNTVWSVNVWKCIRYISNKMNLDQLSPYEYKSFCEVLIHLKRTKLWKEGMKPLRDKINSGVDFDKIFKGAVLARKSYPGFDIRSFIEIFKLYFGDTNAIQRYTNMF